MIRGEREITTIKSYYTRYHIIYSFVGFMKEGFAKRIAHPGQSSHETFREGLFCESLLLVCSVALE